MNLDNESLNAATSMGGISIMAAISRTLLSSDRRSLVGFLRGLALAVFVVIIVGSFIDDYKFSNGLHNTIIGISAFTADDILLLVLKTSRMITAKPGSMIDWLIEFLTGMRKPGKKG